MGNSMSCGSPLTMACLGLTDRRYDPTVSDDLFDQDALWREYAGFWGPEARRYSVAGGTPRPPTPYDPVQKKGLPFRADAFVVFRVIRIEETRYRNMVFYFYEPAPAEFCDQDLPEGMQNFIGNGVCGENGFFQVIEEFGVSTYEKDAKINLIWQNMGPESDEVSGPPRTKISTVSTVENSVFRYLNIPGVVAVAESLTFMGEDRGHLVGSGTATKLDQGNLTQIVSSSLAPRMDEADFVPALRRAFADHSVVDVPDWLSGAGPLGVGCLGVAWGGCPAERDWCDVGRDPGCSSTPYSEPAAVLNAGGITVVVICLVLAMCASFYAVHRWLAARQKDRYKTFFAQEMARKVGHRGSVSQLSPEAMAEEFRCINTAGDGKIQKDELWEFISSEKAGKMTQSDFDALFKAMDLDGRGTVSFLEFTGFMATCGTQYRAGATRRLSGMGVQAQVEEIAKLIDEKKIN